MAKSDLHRLSGKFNGREVRIRIGILLDSCSEEAHPFKESTETMSVSTRGGLILLTSPVAVAQKVRVVTTKSGEEVMCTVSLVLGEMRDKKNVQIIFDQPSPRFWGLQFPPEDWDPRTHKRPSPGPQER